MSGGVSPTSFSTRGRGRSIRCRTATTFTLGRRAVSHYGRDNVQPAVAPFIPMSPPDGDTHDAARSQENHRSYRFTRRTAHPTPDYTISSFLRVPRGGDEAHH